MINFCTLFDSNYLDKALALIYSLKKNAEDFQLFCYCFDNKSYEVLKDLNIKGVVPIRWSDFEDSELQRLKLERSAAEYCWTCTPRIIENALDHFQIENCTYIDADMYFYDDPQILFDEISSSRAHIVIVEHRFTESVFDRRLQRRSGKYCVEFNFFDQTEESRKALSWWKNQCTKWCFATYEDNKHGDQKYLESFPVLFKGVHELQNLGGCVAPWNIRQYALKKYDSRENRIELFEKKTGKTFPLILYHFQSLRYINKDTVNISVGNQKKLLKDAIYIPYLHIIEKSRLMLKRKYDIDFTVAKVYSSNPLMKFWQKYLISYKTLSPSDIYNLRKIRSEKD